MDNQEATTMERIRREGPAEIVEDNSDAKKEVGKVILNNTGAEKHIISNIVPKKALRRVQRRTLTDLSEKVSKTFGPMGSNTMIIKSAQSSQTCVTKYSKDGHTVLKANQYVDPIEISIQSECENITGRVEREVGDGTSSALNMSSLIFNALCDIEDSVKVNPYELMRSFDRVVKMIGEQIRSNARPFSVDDIYDICLIATNGNVSVAKSMEKIYKEYGSDVYIDVAPNTKKEDEIKVYDGMTMDVGYSDEAYVNNTDGTCTIRDARVYYFIDPIDTREMIGLFEKIINDNIVEPMQNDGEPIPTVIVSPIMSKDMSALMENLVSTLYQYNNGAYITQKPPILIITNLGVYEQMFNDIARLCGCKTICKYADPEIQNADIEKGLAPTLDTVTQFYGKCEAVISEVAKTKFINPALIHEYDEDGNIKYDENGNPVHSTTYDVVLKSLDGELENAINNKADANTIGNLKRRINSLKGNMVDFLVGGMSISDRDEKRDLVEDCVLSCRSAAVNGVGFGANYEGLRAAAYALSVIKERDGFRSIDCMMVEAIYNAYESIATILYSTYESDPDEVKNIIKKSIDENSPLNITTGEYDGKVITSIDTDCVILDSISKIITLMFTANQAMLPSAVGNRYIMED